ncbi:MAG: ATP-binding protein [Oscillospiraceae bacterium]|nr:ATP-binding protein [Oscillospiraceae bacterium]
MLYRKIEKVITEHLQSDSKKILLVDGARQVGKTYIIRYVGNKLFENFIEINMVEDSLGDRLFANTNTIEDFYLQVSMLFGDKMKKKENTLIFIDEIQAYPHLLTLLKFLSQDNKFTYIASGSLLGVTLSQTTSIPMGSIRKVRMFPLDFEEFLYANGMNEIVILSLRKKFERLEALDEPMHNKMMDVFRKFLLVGGMPDSVNSYLSEKNIQSVREIQKEIHDYYAADASKYDEENKLKIRRVYDLIPSNMENKKKRVIAQSIENKKGKTFNDYCDEFEYLISAGIALNVQAISNPAFPLIESTGKNLLKLYLNDVGILTGILYGNNIRAVLDDERSINLGSVYETVVASELIAHGHRLFYYDNRNKGEVDYLIDDYDSLSAVPIEVKSGKDYTVHSALNTFVQNEDYHIKKAFVVSNERSVMQKGKITYIPIYYIMFFNADSGSGNMKL